MALQYRIIAIAALVISILLLGGYAVVAFLDQPVDETSIGTVTLTQVEPDGPEAGFQFEGYVAFSLELRAVENATFRDVRLCLYDEAGSVLLSSDLGTFQGATAARNVSVTTAEPPRYVLVHHPRFYEPGNDGAFGVEVLEYLPSDGTYRGTIPGSLPFDVTSLERCSCVPTDGS